MKSNLLETIALTFTYYNPGQVLPNPVVAMYGEDLADLPINECIRAYRNYRLNSKNTKFPLPAQIRAIVRPEEYISAEAQAREIAARICGAIPKYGWSNTAQARAFIGEIGWRAVERQGGWQYLCENVGANINPTSFQAQIRDQIAANVQYGTFTLETKIHALPSNEKELIQLGDLMKRIPAQIKTLPSSTIPNQEPV